MHNPGWLRWMSIVTAAAIVLCYVPLLARTITYDEAFTYNQYASQGFARSLLGYTAPNNHILHTLLVWISTALLGSSTTAIRLPAFFAALVSLGALYWLAATLGQPRTGLLAVALLASQPAFIEFAVSARGYSLAMALTLLAVLAVQPPQSISYRRSYTLLALSAALTMVLPTMILFIAVLLVFSRVKIPIVIGALIGLVPYGPAVIVGAVGDFDQYGLSIDDLLRQAANLYHTPLTWIVLIGALAYSWQARDKPIVRLALCAAGVGLAVEILASLFGRGFPARTLLYLLPLVTLLAALYIGEKLGTYAVVLTLPLLVLVGLYARQSPTGVDHTLSYIRAQPSSTTVVIGCCVNEAVRYHLKDDARLSMRPQTARLLILLDFDDLDKVVEDYHLQETIRGCAPLEAYHDLTILECAFKTPLVAFPVS